VRQRLAAIIENIDWWQVFSITFVVLAIGNLVNEATEPIMRWLWALQLPVHGYNIAARTASKRERRDLDLMDALVEHIRQLERHQ